MSAPSPQLERLLTAEEVAPLLGVSRSMVYKLRRTGELPAAKVGSLLRFHPDAVRGYQHGDVGARGLRRIQ